MIPTALAYRFTAIELVTLPALQSALADRKAATITRLAGPGNHCNLGTQSVRHFSSRGPALLARTPAPCILQLGHCR